MSIIKEKREEQRISQNELGKRVGLSQQQINKIERDDNIPLKHIPAFARALKIPVTDLLPESFRIIKFSQAPSPDTVSIAVLDARACCGNGIENADDKVVGYWHIPETEYREITHANPDNIKMLRVFGDSMEPTLKDGDWVLVDISRNFLDSDGLYLIKKTTALAVKRLQTTVSGDILIKSDNTKYDTEREPLSVIVIIGKVVYTLKAEKVG